VKLRRHAGAHSTRFVQDNINISNIRVNDSTEYTTDTVSLGSSPDGSIGGFFKAFTTLGTPIALPFTNWVQK
jgi:hypothetical protein